METKEALKKYEAIAEAAKLLRQSEKDFPKNRVQHVIYKGQLDRALEALEH